MDTNDFTLDEYREIITAAAKRYRFIRFDEVSVEEGVALWRHDIDFSPHRALAMARIEAELGVCATYFVQISSLYYNIFEPDITTILNKIIELGHGIGLHFDAEVCSRKSKQEIDERIKFEACIIEKLTNYRVNSFTLHNPTTIVGVNFDQKERAGLINGSNPILRTNYEYCSDSNGQWRFKKLIDLIKDQSVSRLYALTHPEWWQDSVMLPRQRLQRCIDGRAENCSSKYDNLLAKHKRQNIGNDKMKHE